MTLNTIKSSIMMTFSFEKIILVQCRWENQLERKNGEALKIDETRDDSEFNYSGRREVGGIKTFKMNQNANKSD